MKTSLFVTVTLLAAAALAGCADNGPNVSYGSIRGNLTPELKGSVERDIDRDRHMASTDDMNWRLMSDDFGRTFYTNHPSTLTPLPVANTSGMPH